jgi:hypothetical protein
MVRNDHGRFNLPPAQVRQNAVPVVPPQDFHIAQRAQWKDTGKSDFWQSGLPSKMLLSGAA